MFYFKAQGFYGDSAEDFYESGLASACDWNEALEQLFEEFGKENIISLSLTPLDDVLYVSDCPKLQTFLEDYDN